jgi:hypothetical protein
VVTVPSRDTDWLAEFPSEENIPAVAPAPVDDALDLFPAETAEPTPAPRTLTPATAAPPAPKPPQPATLASSVRATLARFVFGV